MNPQMLKLPKTAMAAALALTLVSLSGCVTDDALNDDHIHTAAHASDNYPLQAMRHGARKCGQWPQDLTETSDNVRYPNQGCAVQANIAAMIANPGTINTPTAADMPLGEPAAAAVRNVNAKSGGSSSSGFASLFGSGSP